MKKIIALVLVFVMCAAFFAACGKTEEAAPAADTEKTEEPAKTEKTEETAKTEEITEAAAKSDESFTLIVANADASTSMCEFYIETLCSQMTEASDGRLSFVFNPGGSLLGATETIDGVKEGAADICWSSTSFFSGRFPVSEFINLSGNGITSARMATDVYQQMYEEIPELQSEFADWKIIALHSCAYGPISTINKKIETKDDFKGLLIRTAGTVASQYVEALGATPMSVPTSEVYENVSKGDIDGFTNDWHNIDCFKLYEPIDYCLDLPVSYTSCFVLMNKDTYNNLPNDLKAIVDTYAGNYAGDMAGYWWDSCNYWVADKMAANGVEVYKPSDELYAWATSDEIVGPIHQWYINYLNEAGLDGQAIYDKCMSIVEANTAAHADDWVSEFHYSYWDVDAAGY